MPFFACHIAYIFTRMKNTNSLLLWLAAGAAALFFWAKSKAITALQFYISDVSADFINGKPVILLDVTIQNPTNERFTIQSVVGTLTANGQPIGNVQSYVSRDVLPVNSTIYPVQIVISSLGVAMSVYNLITQGLGTSQEIGFNGAINASNIVAPVNLTAKIG